MEKVLFAFKDLTLRTSERTYFENLQFSLLPGEVHAVLATQVHMLDYFLNMLCAKDPLPKGSVCYKDKEFPMDDFLRNGKSIEYILQENLLYDEFSVFENLSFDRMFSLKYDKKKFKEECEYILSKIDMKLILKQKVNMLNPEEKKFIEFLKFTFSKRQIAVLSEAALRLSPEYLFKLEKLIDIYKNREKSIIFITSSLDDALKISDRISVMDSWTISETFSSSDIQKNSQKVWRMLSSWRHIETSEDEDLLATFEAFVRIRNISFSTYELSNVLHSIADNIKKLMRADYCHIYLILSDEIVTISDESRNGEDTVELTTKFINDFTKSMQNRFVYTISDHGFIDIFIKETSCNTIICVPVFLEGERIGVLQLSYNNTHAFSKQEYVMLDMLNREISMAVETSKLLGRSILLQESHHRIKNNLQTIINLLYLQDIAAKHSTNGPNSIDIDTIVNRIKSIASVHDLITQGTNTAYLTVKSIIRSVIEIYSSQSVTFFLNLDDIKLNYMHATSIALLINELISNCTKHAFVKDQKKEITVCCERHGETINLSVIDNGKGLPSDFDVDKTISVGMSIIKAVVAEFGGEISFANKKGAVVKIGISSKALSYIKISKKNT